MHVNRPIKLLTISLLYLATISPAHSCSLIPAPSIK
jgi:hypothetical protein